MSENDASKTLSPQRRFILLSYQRTASNLILKILNLEEQPEIAFTDRQNGYFFMPALMISHAIGLRQKPISEWSEAEKIEVRENFQECADNLAKYTTNATSEGKICFLKEHASMLFGPPQTSEVLFGGVQEPWMLKMAEIQGEQTRSKLNMSLFSDQFLNSFTPVFIIRHPALAFPSLQRAYMKLDSLFMGDYEKLEAELTLGATLGWTRSLYDYYTNESGTTPMVLDASDVISNPKILKHFAEAIGMDSTKLKYEWERKTEDEGITSIAKAMVGSLNASDGIIKEKAPAVVDIAVEAKKWKEEFGLDVADYLEELVRAAMPDYEFMKSRRFIYQDTKSV